jgi:hypothetical protein
MRAFLGFTLWPAKSHKLNLTSTFLPAEWQVIAP